MNLKFAKAFIDHIELAGGLLSDELEKMSECSERDVLEEIQERLERCQCDFDDLLDAREATK